MEKNRPQLKILRDSDLADKIGVVIGTRPSLIKQSPVIRELQRQDAPFFVIHTGQHYSYELDQAFFVDLELPEPTYRLDTVRTCTLHGEQTAEMLKGIERILIEERPRAVLVGGDANSNLAGALAARKLNIQICHDEAGLRSYEWRTPEEHNRVMIDHISEFLFAPNEEAKQILEGEKVQGQIFITGSTIVDAVFENLDLAQRKSKILAQLGLERDEYILMTLHHEENVDYREILTEIVRGVEMVIHETGRPVVLPAHPRTRQRLVQFELFERLGRVSNFRLVEPVGYFDFLMLLANAALVMTDSGGVIQESCILRVPCATLGTYTEWTETLKIGANRICGNEAEGVLRTSTEMLQVDRNWSTPFGGRGPAKRIVDTIQKEILG